MTIHPDMARSFKDMNFILHDEKRVSNDLMYINLTRGSWLCRDHLFDIITFQVDRTFGNTSDDEYPTLGSYYRIELENPTKIGQYAYAVFFDIQLGNGEMQSVKRTALICWKIQGFYWFLITPETRTYPKLYFLVLRSRISQDVSNKQILYGGPPSPVNVQLYGLVQPMTANLVVEGLERVYKTHVREVIAGPSRTEGMNTRVLFREFNKTQRTSVCSMVCGAFVQSAMAGSNDHLRKTKYIVATENPYYLGELILADGENDKIHVLDCMVTVQGSRDYQHLYAAADPNSLVALFLLQNIGDDPNHGYQLIARMNKFDNLKLFYCSSLKK